MGPGAAGRRPDGAGGVRAQATDTKPGELGGAGAGSSTSERRDAIKGSTRHVLVFGLTHTVPGGTQANKTQHTQLLPGFPWVELVSLFLSDECFLFSSGCFAGSVVH